MNTDMEGNINYQSFLNLLFKDSDFTLNSFLGDGIYYISNNSKTIHRIINSIKKDDHTNIVLKCNFEGIKKVFKKQYTHEFSLLKFKFPFIDFNFEESLSQADLELVDLISEVFGTSLHGYIFGVYNVTYYFPINENIFFINSFDFIQYLQNFKQSKKESDFLYSLSEIDEFQIDINNLLQLSEEARLSLETIQEKLKALSDSGELLNYAVFIQKSLTYFTLKNKTIYSKLYIDDNYRFFLMDYNLEVKMNSLTKAIYLFFLKASLVNSHIKGINVDQIYSTHIPFAPPLNNQIMEFYRRTSNFENYDKQLQSVDNVLKNKDLLYMHFSRIKSAFYNVVHESIADKYILKGKRGENKYIDLSLDLIICDDPFLITEDFF